MSNTDLPGDFRERFLAIHTALFCDSLDRMGIQPQVMDYRIRAVYPGAVVVGRALPVLWVSVYRPPEKPYEHLFEAFRALQQDDVLVMTTSGFRTAGVWGGLLDSEGRAEAIEWGTPIDCGGARVNHGDIVFADEMGGIVIPAESAAEVLARAEEKQRGESNVREILATGRDIGEVFREYGIL